MLWKQLFEFNFKGSNIFKVNYCETYKFHHGIQFLIDNCKYSVYREKSIYDIYQKLNLYLDEEKLMKISYVVGYLNNLEVLSISHNCLNIIPTELGRLFNLRSLDISYNQIDSMPTELGQLYNLEYLNCRNNKITILPTELGQLKNIEFMYFSNNEIISIPTEFGNLSKLQELYLHNNKIKNIPIELNNLMYLRQIITIYDYLDIIIPEVFVKKYCDNGRYLMITSNKYKPNYTK
jgi:Leucine-rich repeat (LRR) protein